MSALCTNMVRLSALTLSIYTCWLIRGEACLHTAVGEHAVRQSDRKIPRHLGGKGLATAVR